jgi:hypothetical protein
MQSMTMLFQKEIISSLPINMILCNVDLFVYSSIHAKKDTEPLMEINLVFLAKLSMVWAFCHSTELYMH